MPPVLYVNVFVFLLPAIARLRHDVDSEYVLEQDRLLHAMEKRKITDEMQDTRWNAR